MMVSANQPGGSFTTNADPSPEKSRTLLLGSLIAGETGPRITARLPRTRFKQKHKRTAGTPIFASSSVVVVRPPRNPWLLYYCGGLSAGQAFLSSDLFSLLT